MVCTWICHGGGDWGVLIEYGAVEGDSSATRDRIFQLFVHLIWIGKWEYGLDTSGDRSSKCDGCGSYAAGDTKDPIEPVLFLRGMLGSYRDYFTPDDGAFTFISFGSFRTKANIILWGLT